MKRKLSSLMSLALLGSLVGIICVLPSGIWRAPSISVKIGPDTYNSDVQFGSKNIWQVADLSTPPQILYVSFEFHSRDVKQSGTLFSTSTARDKGIQLKTQRNGKLAVYFFTRVDRSVSAFHFESENRIKADQWNRVTLSLDKAQQIFEIKLNEIVTDNQYLERQVAEALSNISIHIDTVLLGSKTVGNVNIRDFRLTYGHTNSGVNMEAVKFLLLVMTIGVFVPRILTYLRRTRSKDWFLNQINALTISKPGILVSLLLVFAALVVPTSHTSRFGPSLERVVEQSRIQSNEGWWKLDWKLDFSIFAFPPNESLAVASYGKTLNSGVHLMVDRFGVPYLLLGSQSAGTENYELVLLGAPIIGRHKFEMTYISDAAGKKFFSCKLDGKLVELKSAKSDRVFSAENLSLLPLDPVGLQDVKFGGEQSRVWEEQLQISNRRSISASGPIKRVLFFLAAIAPFSFGLVRRRKVPTL